MSEGELGFFSDHAVKGVGKFLRAADVVTPCDVGEVAGLAPLARDLTTIVAEDADACGSRVVVIGAEQLEEAADDETGADEALDVDGDAREIPSAVGRFELAAHEGHGARRSNCLGRVNDLLLFARDVALDRCESAVFGGDDVLDSSKLGVADDGHVWVSSGKSPRQAVLLAELGLPRPVSAMRNFERLARTNWFPRVELTAILRRMAVIYQLTSAEERIFRGNGMTWVDSAGKQLRPLSDEEIKQVEAHRTRKRGFTLTEGGVTYTPKASRDIFKKMLFDRIGNAIIKGVNGKYRGRLIDPNVVRPTAAQSAAIAPPAVNCACRDWGAAPGQLAEHAKRGLHHPVCIHAASNPKEEVAAPPADVSEPVDVSRIPSPSACACRAWPAPEGWNPARHHPTCEWRDAWEVSQGEVPEMWIVDLKTTKRLRRATADEIDASIVRLEETGAQLIEIDATEYAVISDRELDARETQSEEARGDEEAAANVSELALRMKSLSPSEKKALIAALTGA